MKQYANLHNHTTHSDGVYSPTEIVRIAKKEGYGAFAVTDHDVASAYEETLAACKACGIECMLGAEFSSSASMGAAFHIVGLGFDPNQPDMRDYLQKLSYEETHQTQVLFERGVKEGLIVGITWEEVLEYNKGITWLCNEHVFRAMKAKGLKKDIDYRDFFFSVYGDRRGEVPRTHPFLSPDKLIALIHAAGGLAIFAHPGREFAYVDKLIEFGIDGLEVWYNSSRNDNALKRKQLQTAYKHGLFVSGGSDHSGLCGGQYERYENPELSAHYAPPCSLGTTEIFFRDMRTRKLSNEREKHIDELVEYYKDG